MTKRKEMSDWELGKAVDALGAWFESQGIRPADAVTIMATGICVAVVSISAQRNDKLSKTLDGIEAASHLVLGNFRR